MGPADTPSRSTDSDPDGESGATAAGGADRHRRGGRRSAGEPLAASWRPDRPERRERPRGVRGVLTTYGWRVYALPALVAVTALVVVQTAGDKGGDAAAATPGQQALVTDDGSTVDAGPPVATEQPAKPVDAGVPTADLPAGGPFTQAGAGRWHGVAGETAKVGGAATVYTYTVEVEDGIDPSSYGGDDAFGKLIDSTLADPRGWTSGGQIAVQRVQPGFANPTMRISLTSPETTHRICGYSIKYESSCWQSDEDRVVVNLARWVRGAVVFDGDMLTYRQYAINHEVGHAFRNKHVGCAQAGALAPVMMQQSFGVANDYVAALNRAVGLTDAVKSDGLVCKPNAWPNPTARAAG
ncbi:hypothetical protein BJP25_04080 [Actinokineospora bangkokensis]|uniref:DUF3152 domain-containing protein n=1 Tax=Actinokineospora bangkokensis TaxID=1193682 RepID=A0A1Q9LE81_9PSEU|nr:hypothetical protein BJP25_04080 [Actinokineospora bangkokensis]